MNDRPTILPQSVRDAEAVANAHTDTARLTAREKAQLRGWNIDPEVTPGNPHGVNECGCTQRRRTAKAQRPVYGDPEFHCPCHCHGRTFKHYLRGA